MSDLAKIEQSGALELHTMDDLARLSKMLSESGYFKDAADAAKCGVKVLAGMEMGFGPFASMTGISIINGKPEIGAHLLAAAIKRHPKYDYQVKTLTHESCAIEFFEHGKPVGIETFTIDDAKRAGIYDKNPNWKKFPKNMTFARCLSNGKRWYCPDVTDAPVYTEGEISNETISQENPTPIASEATTPTLDTGSEKAKLIQQLFDAAKEADPELITHAQVTNGMTVKPLVTKEAVLEFLGVESLNEAAEEQLNEWIAGFKELNS